MHKPPEERNRRFTRVPFTAVVMLRTDQGQRECAVIDISLKGALLSRPADWIVKSGMNVELDIQIAEGVRIHMQGIVAHVEAEHFGVLCQHIDLDSAAHLRRLVEFNLGDETQLHRELQALILRD